MGSLIDIYAFLPWPITTHPNTAQALPDGILTRMEYNALRKLPPEVALLLPTHRDTTTVPLPSVSSGGQAIGIFLCNPFTNVRLIIQQLQQQTSRWVCNFPSVVQHDDDFLCHLDDVDMGFETELTLLKQIKRAGFKVITTVSRVDEAEQAIAAGADALFVVPQVHSFESGFPSSLAREAQVMAIRKSVPSFSGAIIGLLLESESRLPSTWPHGFDAGVTRPHVAA